MLDQKSAKSRLLNELNADLETDENARVMKGGQYIVLDELTIEKRYGWVFDVRFETQDGEQHDLYGNVGMIVDKNGGIYTLGSGYSQRTMIKIHEARYNPAWWRELIAGIYMDFIG
jgi:hypothetical protein